MLESLFTEGGHADGHANGFLWSTKTAAAVVSKIERAKRNAEIVVPIVDLLRARVG